LLLRPLHNFFFSDGGGVASFGVHKISRFQDFKVWGGVASFGSPRVSTLLDEGDGNEAMLTMSIGGSRDSTMAEQSYRQAVAAAVGCN